MSEASATPRRRADQKTSTFFIYRDADRQWRWRLTAPNKQVRADSGEAYTRLENCVKAVDHFLDAGYIARVEIIC